MYAEVVIPESERLLTAREVAGYLGVPVATLYAWRSRGGGPPAFKDLLLFVSEQLADDPTFGETKLNKILFFADVEAYRLLGTPITGAEYQKNKYGPTARMYPPLRDELERTGQITLERRRVVDHVQDVVHPQVQANMTQFGPDEAAIIDAVIAEFRLYTNIEASDKSHERSAGWRARQLGETIPYEDWIIDPEPADAEAVALLRRAEGLSV